MKWFPKKLFSHEEGSIAVEFAFLVTILSVMVVGVLDYGLAYTREMQMSSAVRAGTQFALARHPDIGADADAVDALISVGTIRNQVALAAPFVTDPANQIDITIICDCLDTLSNPLTSVCTSEAELSANCATVEATYLSVEMSLPYDMTITFPGFPSQLNLSSNHTVLIQKN